MRTSERSTPNPRSNNARAVEDRGSPGPDSAVVAGVRELEVEASTLEKDLGRVVWPQWSHPAPEAQVAQRVSKSLRPGVPERALSVNRSAWRSSGSLDPPSSSFG